MSPQRSLKRSAKQVRYPPLSRKLFLSNFWGPLHCAPLSNFDNYAANLEKYLWQTLNTIINNQINKQSEFRLIFHLYKGASNKYEIPAINSVIKRFENLSFKYAFLHLGYGHNFRVFNNDGKLNVNRGTFIKLDSNSALIHFVPENSLPLYVQLLNLANISKL